VFATAYQRDFGAMVDDPQRAASWESQYKTLMMSANIGGVAQAVHGACMAIDDTLSCRYTAEV